MEQRLAIDTLELDRFSSIPRPTELAFMQRT